MFQVELAHGIADHATFPCYQAQHLISAYDSSSWVSTALFLFRARGWLRLNAGRFDVFHGLNIFDVDVQPALCAEALGLPSVLVPANHKAGLVPSNSRVRRLLGRHRSRQRAIGQVSALAAVSSDIETELLDVGVQAAKVARIPFGVNTQRFQPVVDKTAVRAELKLERPFVILFVGEISDRKRPHWILPGLSKLVREGVDAVLVMVGPIKDQAYWQFFQQRAQEVGVADRVDWRGFVPKVEQFYQAADVFVLPSQNEGLPNALLEALASGVPSICTPISGCNDVLADGSCGRLVCDEEELAKSLLDYSAAETLKTVAGKAARQKSVEIFDMEKVVGRYHQLFTTLAMKRSRAKGCWAI
jgi:glycosyltransferase involved in cell wall biosynthesis